MLSLLLSGAVLLGVGTTTRVGEDSPAFVMAADARRGWVQGEAWLTTAPKLESQDGWASRLGMDFWSGPISLGASWAHRETSLWSKDRLFIRASTQHGPLRLIAEVAPDSPNLEAKGEARLRLSAPAWGGRVVLEPRAFVQTHSTVEELGGYAWGFAMLVGVGK